MAASADVLGVRNRNSSPGTLTIEECLTHFDRDPTAISRRMHDLLEQGGEDLLEQARSALSMLWHSKGAPHFLAMAALVPTPHISFGAAVDLVLEVQKHDPLAGVKTAQVIARDPGQMSPEISFRVLDLLSATTELPRVLPLLTTFLRHSDARVRSKTALMIGKANQSLSWVGKLLDDPVPRIRANAVEALWGMATPEAIALFRRAASDPDNRVMANAILGLCTAGDPTGSELLERMSKHADARFRASAVWVMGQTGDLRYANSLTGLRSDSDSKVRFLVLHSLARLRRAGAGPGAVSSEAPVCA